MLRGGGIRLWGDEAVVGVHTLKNAPTLLLPYFFFGEVGTEMELCIDSKHFASPLHLSPAPSGMLQASHVLDEHASCAKRIAARSGQPCKQFQQLLQAHVPQPELAFSTSLNTKVLLAC
jgi:hypothetical protein